MPVINRIAGYPPEMAEWRRWMHRNPELSFDCHRTAAFVAERLREFGVDEIHEGIATTGIVAIVNGQGPGPTVGLRADMDALPIARRAASPMPLKSQGKMHACGHDGHTAMLLGAAKYLAETRNFRGRVALIFQPAEEDGGGGEVMVREGIMDRFDIAEVYALHNAPNFAEGQFYTTPGRSWRPWTSSRSRSRAAAAMPPCRTRPPTRSSPPCDGAGVPDHRQPQPQAGGRPRRLGHAVPGRDGQQRDPRTAVFSGTVRTFTPRRSGRW
jgi:metal-dependent amidase/aminoacylase/carboxypeptidase family protein